MNTIKYNLRSPFMTRIGQFEPGKQTLVVGVLQDVIAKDATLKLELGKKTYLAETKRLRGVKHTVWKNRDGKTVWIIPLYEFEIVGEEKEKGIEQKSLW